MVILYVNEIYLCPNDVGHHLGPDGSRMLMVGDELASVTLSDATCHMCQNIILISLESNRIIES